MRHGIREPSLPNRVDMEKPLLKELIKLGGSVNFSKEGRALEISLAREFKLSDETRDFSAPNYHSEGNRRWRHHIQFVRQQLVYRGEMENSVHGKWTVTDAGYRRVGMKNPSTQN
jgi:hypothetical protein